MAGAVDLDLLRSPATGQALVRDAGGDLVTADGLRRYPIVDGVPILIDDERSLFRVADFRPAAAAEPPSLKRRLRARLRARLGGSPVSAGNLAELAGRLEAAHRADGRVQRVLVVGGGILGYGMEALTGTPGVELVETDVYVGPRTQLVCDAHDLPFADGAFQAVVVQAVLEHVLDPPRVVAEIHRVLAADGLVYSEIPFMQQVHEGPYDFTRYTRTGHRRLLRDFDELSSGAVSGTAVALIWSVRYFAVTLAGDSRRRQALADLAARLLTVWLVPLDRVLLARPAALDGASGTWILGRRRDTPVADEDVIASHRGVNGTPDR
jgi:SAM-dependent methyltransferase